MPLDASPVTLQPLEWSRRGQSRNVRATGLHVDARPTGLARISHCSGVMVTDSNLPGARALITALGTPRPRPDRWIGESADVGTLDAALSFAAGGLALICELEGVEAVAALLGADDRIALASPGSCTSDEETINLR